MNKPNFKKFALMGMAGGMLIASQSPLAADAASQATDANTTLYAGGCGGGKCGSGKCGSKCGSNQNKNRNSQSQQYYNTAYDDQQQASGKIMTESDLLNQLGTEGKTIYQNLSPEGKALALRLANQYPDKLQAIRMAAQQMAEKRAQMSGNRVVPQPQQYGSQTQYDRDQQQPPPQYNRSSSSRY